jgi:hypothetical protein
MVSISRSEFKRQIQQMDAIEFEHFVADIWSERGWKTRVTKESEDRGIDVVATKDTPVSEKHLIQAKRYGADNTVGSPDIQQYASLRQQEQDVDAVVVVTSNQFTEQAERVARDLNVKLVDGDDLYEIVEKHSLSTVLADYLSVPESANSQTQSEVNKTISPGSTDKNTTNTIKILSIVGAAILILLCASAVGAVMLDGTGGGSVSESPAESNDTSTPTTDSDSEDSDSTLSKQSDQTEKLSLGQYSSRGELNVTVSDYLLTDSISTQYSQNLNEPSEGAQFLLARIKVINVGNTQANAPSHFELDYYDEKIDGYHVTTFEESKIGVDSKELHLYQDGWTQRELYPNNSKEGWMAFEVPQNFDEQSASIQIGYTEQPRWRLSN